jgi:hypothetical protein
MAGSIQLESKGLLDLYTTENPEFTFFKENFKKHSNFSLQFIDIPSNKDVEYGEIHRFNIPYDHCDVLRGVNLMFSLPDIVLANGVDAGKDYVYGEACNFIDYITLSVGGIVIQHITTEYLDMYTELEYPTTKQINLFNMSMRDVSSNPAEVNSRISKTRPYPRQLGGDVCIEIPFYFHNHPKLALPVCALMRQEIEVEVKFRNVEECICVSRHQVEEIEGFIGANVNDLVTYKPYNLRLSTECVFLDPVEKIKVMNREHEFAITQIQYNDILVDEDDGNAEPKFKLRLSFTNLVQELYFFVLYTENNAFGGTSNYNVIPLKSSGIEADPSLRYEHIDYVTLTLDGDEVLDQHTGSPHFLRILQPRLHHRNTPITRRFYSYSFALYPNDDDASGHVNFSVVKEPILHGNLFSSKHEIGNTGNYAWHNRRFHILAKTMNFIRIKDGVMSQVFDYMT